MPGVHRPLESGVEPFDVAQGLRPPQSKESRQCRDSVSYRAGRQAKLWTAGGLTLLFGHTPQASRPCARAASALPVVLDRSRSPAQAQAVLDVVVDDEVQFLIREAVVPRQHPVDLVQDGLG